MEKVQEKRKHGQHGYYYTGDKFRSIVRERHPSYTILGEVPLGRFEKTLVRCSDCGQTFDVSKRHLLEESTACPVCAGTTMP